MSKLIEILKLTRIEHSAMLVIAVVAAELITAGRLPSPGIFALSIITPIFISMGAFAINDYFDIKVDRANKKSRPLVTGALTSSEALWITLVCMAIGVVASLFINIYCFAIALFFALMSLLYSYRLKELLFWGNAYIALSMVIPFVYGDYVMSTLLGGSIVLVSVMIFASGLAREIHGTIRDYRGDIKVRNARTVPKVIGIRSAAIFSLLLYLVAIVISAYLFLYVKPFAFNLVYAILVGITDLLLIYVGVGYVAIGKQKFYESTRNVSLAAMGIALIAVLLSALA
ncbi:MAG: UbiA family prenyltransferase [Candidatus Micrarchaeota archaeon]|nr:UbiA family prenyltransferase [Candidatus Micrarchaeota archaeon]MDE1848224.1 UbiA family prenyltransferase [Candidatus Micrarchaeota archaeon]MDE1864890.1 UbiA family prenyltransferase [Candidatus Micrarchaeota archaeon]